MEVRHGYKQTEVGLIPDDWDVKTVDQVAFVTSGKRLPLGSSLADTPTPHPYVRVTDMRPGTVDVSDIKYVPVSVAPAIQRYRIYRHDIFISVAGSLGIVGKIPAALDGANLTENADRITDISCSQDYLLYVLMSPLIQNVIDSICTVGAQPKLALTRIRKFAVPLPPTDAEQRAIAAALSDVDALLGGMDRVITKKRELRQAAMQQLLTGKTRLQGFGPTKSFARFAYGSIPDDWTTMPLSVAGTMNGRIGWQGLKQREFTDNPDDPFLITGMNFKDGRIRWEDVYHIPMTRYKEAPQIQLRPGDVLMTKDGTIGKLLFVESIPYPGLASLNSHLLVLRPAAGRFVPRFLFYQLSSPPFAQHIELHKSGTTFCGLTQTATGKYPVVLPSIAEQTAIAEVLRDMDAEIATLEERRDKTRGLKQAMMQELLTGKTRLVQPEAALA